jgi:tRNA pseudouridine55 synthase
MPAPPLHGLLVLDKPAGITSRDALNRAQRWLPRGTKVGHTGTLDPLATGVLVICLGVATRLAEYVQDMGKTYRAVIRLGARSDTDDADGTVTPGPTGSPVDRAAVEEALRGFVGEIEQVPPAYSAAKVGGRRAYEVARRGGDVELAARRVTVYGIDILAYDYPRLEIEVRCGRGTYIRSLARDLGERLGCGGYIEALRRTRVGPFAVEDGVPLDSDVAAAVAKLLPPSGAVSEMPRVTLDELTVARLRHGQAVPAPPAQPGEIAVFDRRGELVAVAQLDETDGPLRADKVFPEGTR